MKLTTKREDLVSKLSIVSRAVSTRAATQALSGVLLNAADGRVTLAATDLDLGLETTLDAEIEDGGAILLPGRLFAEVARSLADPTVEIESREAEFEADVELREQRMEAWRAELTELEQRLDRKETELTLYVGELQGELSKREPGWWPLAERPLRHH